MRLEIYLSINEKHHLEAPDIQNVAVELQLIDSLCQPVIVEHISDFIHFVLDAKRAVKCSCCVLIN